MTSFGQQFLACETYSNLFELEKSYQRDERFIELDSLISDLAIRSLQGERIASMSIDELHNGKLQIHNLKSSQTQFIKDFYDTTRQKERGSWSFPAKQTIDVGWLNLTHNFADFSYFPLSAAGGEVCRVELETSPEAVFLWSVFSPFMEKLTHPIKLRSTLTGVYDFEELKSVWADLNDFYTALQLSDIETLNVFRFRGGWSKLENRAEQLEAKKKLLEEISQNLNTSTGTYYRLYALKPLVEQYYKKAKTDGIAKRKQVITKAFQPHLSGFFGGDWLALVEYLGEHPHPDEQIVTALPKPKIFASGATRAKEIAQEEGVSTSEVEKIAAAFWQKKSGSSPIEERVACLKKYWQIFDDLHHRQKPGMKSLWGLVEEYKGLRFEVFNDEIFHQDLHLELLPPDLIQSIENFWGTTILNKYPDRIVSELFPHAVFANVFGPALFFWQNCSLTAWFLCEGPYSRTDMEGLEHHQRRYLAELKDVGTPIPKQMFVELIEAEKYLGPEEQIETETTNKTLDFGISITMSVNSGSHRKGFESLRNIITRYRREWTNKHLEQYLKTRWESEITEAANKFFLKMSDKSGKPPTVKQFVSSAALPTKNWFGGDISYLYTAIGEKIPFRPTKNLLMPMNKLAFALKITELLPTQDFEYYGGTSDEGVREQYIQELAKKALDFVQIYEAKSEIPTLKEFRTKFKYHSPVLSNDENQAWEIYVETILRVLQNTKSELPTPPVIKEEAVFVSPVSQPENSNPIAVDKPKISDKPNPPIKPPPESNKINITSTEKKSSRRSWLDRFLGRK